MQSNRIPLHSAVIYISVALISAAAIAYEILLIRLLSIIHWHHFAYMIISVALLGFGASGTFLSLLKREHTEAFVQLYSINAIGFGVLSLIASRSTPLQMTITYRNIRC